VSLRHFQEAVDLLRHSGQDLHGRGHLLPAKDGRTIRLLQALQALITQTRKHREVPQDKVD
jgi:hypothetical protein